jgi:hypothetical protein
MSDTDKPESCNTLPVPVKRKCAYFLLALPDRWAEICERWPHLDHQEGHLQYMRRELIGTQCLLKLPKLSKRIKTIHALQLQLAGLDPRTVMFAQPVQLRALLLREATAGRWRNLQQFAIEPVRDEPYVLPEQLRRVLNPMMQRERAWLFRGTFWNLLLAPINRWYLEGAVREEVLAQVADPLRVLGVARRRDGWQYVIRLSGFKDGPLRHMLQRMVAGSIPPTGIWPLLRSMMEHRPPLSSRGMLKVLEVAGYRMGARQLRRYKAKLRAHLANPPGSGVMG